MAAENPSRTANAKGTRRAVITGLVVATALAFGVVFSQSWFNLSFLHPASGSQTLAFAALSAITFLLLLALTFVLGRNLLKLFAERRLGVVGSKFRTRMVIGALVLSFVPVILLCFFAYGLLNRSIVKWYSRPPEEVRQSTSEVANTLLTYAAQNAAAEADSIAASEEARASVRNGNFNGLIAEFRRHQTTLQGGFALALACSPPARTLSGCSSEASFQAPEAWPLLRDHFDFPVSAGAGAAPLVLGGNAFVVGAASLANGAIVVALPLPKEFNQNLNRLHASEQWYIEIANQLKQVRRTYIGILLLVTALLLFVSTWLAMFVAKLVTRPVAALAEATQEISRGNLDYRIRVAAADELGELVAKFNRMAGELETNRRELEASSAELARANAQVEQRRQQIETILENIPTGVLSIDPALTIVHANSSALGGLAMPAKQSLMGSSLRNILPPETMDDLLKLMRKADRMGSTTTQLDLYGPRGDYQAAVTVASLSHDGRRLGYVIVIEDLSDLVKAQRQAAWREVARRVAHEIKNPLTPITLSAARIEKHLERGTPDAGSLAVIHNCAQTISGAVETVRKLVDEFSMLARFPTAQPQLTSVGTVVENALAMFEGRLDGIQVHRLIAPDVPPVMLDPEAMKRALANLVDNAAEAMRGSLVKEIFISSSLVAGRDAVEIVVADSGQGLTSDVKEKLFLPYFSTKDRGTGLGLAIVSRIIEEHHGSIRVEENNPVGARFIIELPVTADAVLQATHA